MKRMMVTLCFALLAVTGCMTDPKSDGVAQDDTVARVQAAVSSVQANQVTPDIELFNAAVKQVSGGAEPRLRCISDGECVSCCHISVCCSKCGSGPTVCT